MNLLCRGQKYCLYTIHGSHNTIHIFKNYFATLFSVFSFNKNKLYPNRLLSSFTTSILEYKLRNSPTGTKSYIWTDFFTLQQILTLDLRSHLMERIIPSLVRSSNQSKFINFIHILQVKEH